MAWQDYSSAPESGTFIRNIKDISDAVIVMITTAKGEFPLLLVKTATAIKAYVNACPHQYLPLDYLGKQVLSADGTKLLCTAHGAIFDAATGDAIAGDECALEAVPVEISEGAIKVGHDIELDAPS